MIKSLYQRQIGDLTSQASTSFITEQQALITQQRNLIMKQQTSLTQQQAFITQQQALLYMSHQEATLRQQEAAVLRQKYFLLNRHQSAEAKKPSMGRTFPLFSLLPAEIRLKIWKLICAVPRLVRYGLAIYDDSIVRYPSPPTVFSTCQESRAEGNKVYKKIGFYIEDLNQFKVIHFNFEVDILWIDDRYIMMQRLEQIRMPADVSHFLRLTVSWISDYITTDPDYLFDDFDRIGLDTFPHNYFDEIEFFYINDNVASEKFLRASEIILIPNGNKLPRKIQSPLVE